MVIKLQAFVDDSGSGKREPFFALGGFLSTYENWARFSDVWQGCLDASPQIPWFKSSNAYSGRGVFDGWRRDDIAAKVAALTVIIRQHAMVRISSAVDRRAYQRIYGGKPPPEIDDPYFLCFYQIMHATVGHQMKHGWNTPVDWIFDEQGKLGTETIKWWDQYKRQAHPKFRQLIGSRPIFRDDKLCKPLQAADLYAGALRRNLRDNTYLYLPKRPELRALENIEAIDRQMDMNELAAGTNKLRPRARTAFAVIGSGTPRTAPSS